MKNFCLVFLTVILAISCNRPSIPFPKGTLCRDLRSGEALSLRKAARADGVYGILQTVLDSSAQSITFVRYLPEAFTTDIVSAPGKDAAFTSTLCLDRKALAGINGSFFDMGALTPVSFIKDEGVPDGPATASLTGNGALLSGPDGVRIDAFSSPADAALFPEAIASGPLLMDEDSVLVYDPEASLLDRRHPRSLVGQDAEGYLWLVVVDGRFPGMAEGMTIAELTGLALSLGMTDALNLDGGGSSTLWVRTEGVINHPTDNRTFDHRGERIVPNAILVR